MVLAKSGYAAEAKTIQDLYLAGEKKAAEEAIPDEYLAKNSLIGDEGFVRERLHALKDSGVTALNVGFLGKTVEERVSLRQVAQSSRRDVGNERDALVDHNQVID